MTGEELSEEEIKEMEKINNLSHREMARLWRYAPPGHPYFNTTKPFFFALRKRFEELGGFTPAISKEIDD